MSEKQKRLVDLRTMYYQKTQEILKLKGDIEALERDVQRTCDHEWEYDDSERGVGAGISAASAKSIGDEVRSVEPIFWGEQDQTPKKKKRPMATPLDEAKRIYLEQIPKLQQLNDQMKQVRKIIGAQKRVFKKP